MQLVGLSTPTLCRVGPWLQLTGLLVCSPDTCGTDRSPPGFSANWCGADIPRNFDAIDISGEAAQSLGSSTICRFGPCTKLTGLLSDPSTYHQVGTYNLQFWILRWKAQISILLRYVVTNTLLLAKVALEWLLVSLVTWYFIFVSGQQLVRHFEGVTFRNFRQSQGGKSGPKSRRDLIPTGSVFCGYRFLIVALCWTSCIPLPTDCRGEGYGLAMETVEAPPDWLFTLADTDGAKQHGEQPTLCNRTLLGLRSANKVVKRSLLRAAQTCQAPRNGVVSWQGLHSGRF